MSSLFKKRTTGKYSPNSTVQPKLVSNKELSELIERLQKNADEVERNIVDTDSKLQKDLENIRSSQPVIHKNYTFQNISESDKVIVVLETDALLAKQLNHPQGAMIEEDIRQLKERLKAQRARHEQIYNQKAPSEVPRVNWSKLIDEKMDLLNSRGFATDLPNLENQIVEHNIFNNEVKTIGDHINKDSDKEYITGLQVKYQKLLSASQKRQRDLNTLQDYMQRCTNELYWLDQQEKERMEYDWSDRNSDYISRRRQYENFIQRSLEAKEQEINKLQEEGDKLLAAGHPAKIPIEAHMEAVHADWKEYLNLLICEESHLKYMEDYHQFYRDAKDSQELMRKIDSDLDHKYNPDFKDKYQIEAQLSELEDQEKALDKYDEVVSSLQKRSQQVLPLKFRRETPLKPTPVEALCDFFSEEGEISRGASYTLKANKGEKWEVADSSGKKLVAPGVCFQIPPTDPEAIALGESAANQYRAVKQKAAGSKTALVQRFEDLKRESSRAPPNAQDGQTRQLLAGLDRVITDLDRQEKAISLQLRPPLEQNRAVQDSSERLKELKNISNQVKRIEPEKAQRIQECEVYLSNASGVSSTPILRSKMGETNKKYDRVNELLNSSNEKIEGANRLENSLEKSRELLTTYESKLCEDDTVPEDPKAVDRKQQELAKMISELQNSRALLAEAEQNLYNSKLSCNTLANRFQEHCPDIERQEAEVSKLNQRYTELDKQIQIRSQCLQKAKTAYTGYSSTYDSVNGWLNNLPNYEPKETDSVKQVETKLKNQRLLLGEIADRENDMQLVSSNAQDYQQAVKDYELESEKLRSILDMENRRNTYSKRARIQSPAAKVKEEEADLSAKFTEASAVNKQRMQTLEFAQSLLHQQPEVEVQRETIQMSRSEKPVEEIWKIKKMLEDEVQRRQQLESEIKSTESEIIFLQNQKPQETIVKKEVLKKVPDPQLEEDYHKILERVSEEQRMNKSFQDELDSLRLKVRVLEHEQKEGGQQYIVKEVLRIEKDREQQEEFLRLKEELEELKRHKSTKQSEITNLKERLLILTEEKNKPQEKITEKEVVKLQNDPQLATEYRLLQENVQRENTQRQKEEEELLLLQEKLKRLEKERAMAEGKITVKEVLKVEKDLASEREVADLRRQYEDETSKIRINIREKNELIRKINVLEEENSKVVIQEKVKEIVRPDPKAESELANLRLEVIEQERKYRSSEEQIKVIQSELESLKKRGPQVEVKEITKEVIKHKTDPELLAELEKLRGEILEKTRIVERSQIEITRLKQEIQSWIDTKPQVQIKEVVQEVLQYREDPTTKNEVEKLRSQLSEEQKKRLTLEKEMHSQEEKIRQKERELSQVREKVVQQEVVKFEEDPVLKSEVNNLSKNIQNELKQKDSLQEELRKLQYRKSELERQLEELERERQARREAELEIQRLRMRLSELEQREIETKEKVTLKQKVVLQQDPQQEKEHNLLKLQVEEEKHRRQMLETELAAIRKKLISLEKMELKEKVVFTEKIEVEKDPETEQEIERLKISLDEESRSKRELDTEVDRLQARLSELEFSNSKSNKELEYLREEVHKLQMEKQSLQLETRHLQSEIQITIKEAEDLRSLTQVDSGVNLDSRFLSLQQELNELKKISRDKDLELEQLQKRLDTMAIKREQRENHLRRSIVVIDPDTGREMSPEEARNLGLIDWRMFVNLQSQECDWEETTIKGPNGDSSVIIDKKSGKKFDIESALKGGRITKRQYESYLNKEMSIQEFAALVSGKK